MILTLLPFVLGLAAAVAPQNPLAQPVADDGPRDLYLEIVLNGVPAGRVVPVVHADGDFTIRADILRSLGLTIDSADETDDVPLKTVPGLQVHYDALMQRLDIDRPAIELPGRTLTMRDANPRPAFETAPGMLVNYDVLHQASGPGTRITSAWIEGRGFGRWGNLSHTVRYQRSVRDHEAAVSTTTRYDSTWSMTSPRRRLTVSVGDVVTGAHTWNRAIRLGGISIARNFSVRPDLITYPTPDIGGEATVPSTVDLLLDGRPIARHEVAPGPFTFSDLPVVNGAGSATIVTTDALGRRTERTMSFYVSSALLRQGLADYAVAIGAPRRAYGTESFAYGRMTGSGVIRYGLTDAVTLEGQAAAASTGSTGGVGSTFRIGRAGIAGFSIGASEVRGQQGRQYTARYEYRTAGLGLLLQHERRSADFADGGDLDLSPGAASRRTAEHNIQAFLSFTPLRSMPMTIGYVRGVRAGAPSSVMTFSTSRPVHRRGRLALTGTWRRGALALQVSVTALVGRSTTMQARAAQTADDGPGTRLTVHRPAPIDGGVGVDAALAVGQTADRHGSLTWRTRAFDAQTGTTTQGASTTHWASMRGSIVATGGTIMPTGRVSDGFILVDTNGTPDVPVLFEHRRVGTTNRRGHLLIPGVSAYHAATIAIDPLHLPLDVAVDQVQRQVVVDRHAGTRVRFAVRRVVSASIRLVDPDGEPLPVGSRVTHEEAGTETVVGWAGLVFLEQIDAVNTLHVTLDRGRRCVVSVRADALPISPGAVSRQVCRP